MSARRAGRLLEQLFAGMPEPFEFRLWDGSVVRVGGRGDCRFAIVLPSRRVFRQLLRRPTPYAFGEAYVGGAIDIEGDLFSAMRVGQHLEDLRPPLQWKLTAIAEALRP